MKTLGKFFIFEKTDQNSLFEKLTLKIKKFVFALKTQYLLFC